MKLFKFDLFLQFLYFAKSFLKIKKMFSFHKWKKTICFIGWECASIENVKNIFMLMDSIHMSLFFCQQKKSFFFWQMIELFVIFQNIWQQVYLFKKKIVFFCKFKLSSWRSNPSRYEFTSWSIKIKFWCRSHQSL